MTERKRAAAINADSGEQHDVRLDYAAAAPGVIEALRGLAKVVESSTLEPFLLEFVIVAINGWNRFSVGFRRPVGSYVSHRHPEPGACR